eukprot:757200-Hanusia_phi.AAC.2
MSQVHKSVVVLAKRFCSFRAKPQRLELSLDSISPYFHMKQVEAAKRLGISSTSLKTACRKLGIARWPYRILGPGETNHEREDDSSAMEQGDQISLQEHLIFMRSCSRIHGSNEILLEKDPEDA